MPPRTIRARFDRSTLTVYQAYSAPIADAALASGRFTAPSFSFQRMTWIKPSFLWLMARSNWGRRSGQERILAVRIRRDGWEEALSEGVLTAFTPGVHASVPDWDQQFQQARVHVQWDPERSLHGENLPEDSIQVGISRHLIQTFVDHWIVSVEDLTPLAARIRDLRDRGRTAEARRLLPPEAPYPTPPDLARRLDISTPRR